MFYRILILFSVVAIAFSYALYSKRDLESQIAPTGPAEAVLASLPEAVFSQLDGSEIKIRDLFKQHQAGLMMLHFWGTWCAPCEAELPELLDLVKKLENNPGILFVLVATNDELIKVKKHLEQFKTALGPRIIWLLDQKDQHRELFGTTRVPETFIFASNFATLRKLIGPQEWSKPLYLQMFQDLSAMEKQRL